MMNKIDALFSFQQTALNVRVQRQELLAANIANADTPNYKARDIDFAATLKEALGSATLSPDMKVGSVPASPLSLMHSLPSALGSAAGSLLSTSPLHMAGSFVAGLAGSVLADPVQVKYRSEIQGSVDGNTVDGDVERNQFADNALRYEVAVSELRGEIKNMQAVLQS